MHAHIPPNQVGDHGIPCGGEVRSPAYLRMVGEVRLSLSVYNAAQRLPAVVVERVGGNCFVRM